MEEKVGVAEVFGVDVGGLMIWMGIWRLGFGFGFGFECWIYGREEMAVENW